MKLYVGLGNPDKKYQKTRHNIGHQIIEILKTKNLPDTKLGINDSYMNESGQSVQKLVHFYKVGLNDFYLIHDDLDLPIGEYRIQFDRGAAGHHGVESVIQHLGSPAFNRVRVGIGKPTNNIPVEDYVLQQFNNDEKMIIDQTIDKIVSELMGH
jgi:PTH1 family peptidyl-tRNA hydrolase